MFRERGAAPGTKLIRNHSSILFILFILFILSILCLMAVLWTRPLQEAPDELLQLLVSSGPPHQAGQHQPALLRLSQGEVPPALDPLRPLPSSSSSSSCSRVLSSAPLGGVQAQTRAGASLLQPQGAVGHGAPDPLGPLRPSPRPPQDAAAGRRHQLTVASHRRHAAQTHLKGWNGDAS
ncbi:hypothetical protein EYF80_055725 [Liparis tanakae]|uniref:Uncharacterized protein n=1 Tax=Liparis tanakae TaxID=230148 RepID=A0A4Z2EZC0_9TELE|nr:hypothetical protein EYF80_055725 [Liparis tanakae]